MTDIRISMNYALDALWWKLTSQPVRDLASLLTAPPLWQSGCELSVRELLGEHGFRYLLVLDADPAPLKKHLAQRAPFGHRLGIYAEELLALQIASIHNLAFYLWLVGEARRHILAGDFTTWKAGMVKQLSERI